MIHTAGSSNRVLAVLSTAALLTLTAACRHTNNQPSTFINVANPKTANQLIYGFYGTESNSFRWTAREFSVFLRPPASAEQNGAKLWLRLFIPDTQIEELGPMTLNVDAGDCGLDPQTFSKGGEYQYVRDIPAQVLRTNILPVKFSFDKATPPSEEDERELAVVVTAVGLQPK